MTRLRLAAVAAALSFSALPAAVSVDAAFAEEAAPAAAASGSESIRILYNGRFMGLRVMKASVDAAISEGGYSSKAVFRTAGLAGFFKESRIVASGDGVWAGRVKPTRYRHENLASKKNRKINITFSPDEVVSDVNPPFGSMGQPPATMAERLAALDPIGAFLSIALDGAAAPCERTVPVFDGKQRYDLRFELVKRETVNVRGYEGPGLRCNVYYSPVSGFDPEDLAEPDAYKTPIEIWFADFGDGVTAPVRFKATVSGIAVSVEAKEVSRQPDAG